MGGGKTIPPMPYTDFLNRQSSGTDHPQVIEPSFVFGDDHGPGGEVFNLDARHQPAHVLGVERVEGRLATEEVGELLHGAPLPHVS